jgi:hypothetical protein
MWKNLAPHIIRQRLIIEGTVEKLIEPKHIKEYLVRLSEVAKMETLTKEPVTSYAHELGWAGWIHWKKSGTGFYSYPPLEGRPALFTADIYTCKPFSVRDVVEFTKKFFNPIDIVWKEVEV